MSQKPEDYELYHFGVKGMKWGVRKKLKNKLKTEYSNRQVISRPRTADAKYAASKRTRVKYHGTDSLTNDELKKVVERMNLEQQYANLKEAGKSSSVRRSGQEYIMDVMKEAGKTLLVELFVSGAKSAAGASGSRTSRPGPMQVLPRAIKR